MKNETTESTKSAKANAISKHFSAGNIAVMAILAAISFVLYMFVKFPLPFMFPSFLDMQISDLPALLGGFALGPVEGALIIVIKCCIKMPFTSTACIGELGDIAIGVANVLPAALIYRFFKNRKGAILGMALGMVCAVIVGVLMNWLVLIPFYANKFGMGAIVGMMQALYPNVTADTVYNYYLPLAVVPFNILRCLVCALVTYFTYKPLSKALHWEIGKKKVAEQATDVDGAQADDSAAAAVAEQDTASDGN
ncbi:MAG: ECF transporter S component [Clostridiales bacterium]|nr:ECF transporter S component [Clostridiales bacterium]